MEQNIGLETFKINSSNLPSAILTLMGSIVIIESATKIVVKGFKTEPLLKAINKKWQTSIIGNNIFISIKSDSVVLHKFFCLEFYNILNILIEDKILTPGYKGICKKLISGLEEETWLKHIKSEHKSIIDLNELKRFKKDPLESQMEFFKTYDSKKQQLGLNGYLLTAAPGTGKTISSLMLMACLKKETVIIIAPKSTIARPWELTFSEDFYKTPTFWSSLQKEELQHVNYDYILVHYESIPKLFPMLDLLKKKNIGIIVDEFHNFNEIKSDRTQNYINLVLESNCKDIVPMSGTPVKGMATEIYPSLKVLDPLFTNEAGESFKKIFGVSTGRANDIMCRRLGMMRFNVEKSEVVSNEIIEIDYKVSFKGSEKYTLETLKKEMTSFIVERLNYYKVNKQKYQDMMDKALKVFEATLTKSSKKEIQAFNDYIKNVRLISRTMDLRTINDIIQSVNMYERKVIQPTLSGAVLKDFKDSKSVVKYVSLKVRGEALGRVLGRSRALCHVDMIEHSKLENFVLDARKKTLIFSHYIDVVKGLTTYFSDKGGFNPIPVYQETSKNLPSIIKDFYSDKKINPLIATYGTLSTGVPVTAASTVILFNQPFRSYEREQAIARVDRKDQDGPVTIVNVILDTGEEPNISTRSADIMKWSQEQVEQITGIKTSNDDVLVESIGLENYLDEEINQMKNDSVTLETLYLNSLEMVNNDNIGCEEYNEKFKLHAPYTQDNFVGDVVPSLEGIFDSALQAMDGAWGRWKGLSGGDDCYRVEVFKGSKDFNSIVRYKDYSELADVFVLQPEGLNVPYLDYVKEIKTQFDSLGTFFTTMLPRATAYLAELASGNDKVGSVIPGDFNYLTQFDLSYAKSRFEKLFTPTGTASVQYHKVIKRNNDWDAIYKAIYDTQLAEGKMSPIFIEKSVNDLYTIVEDLVNKIKTDKHFQKLSKVQIKDLHTLTYAIASAVEYYSVINFSWLTFNQSLRSTETVILNLKK